eukprot:5250922-Prymnesium_polylepis.1
MCSPYSRRCSTAPPSSGAPSGSSRARSALPAPPHSRRAHCLSLSPLVSLSHDAPHARCGWRLLIARPRTATGRVVRASRVAEAV